MNEPMTESELAALTHAATDKSLLSAKAALREMPELTDERRELICKVMDGIFQHGFHSGAIYMAERAKELIRG